MQRPEITFWFTLDSLSAKWTNAKPNEPSDYYRNSTSWENWRTDRLNEISGRVSKRSDRQESRYCDSTYGHPPLGVDGDLRRTDPQHRQIRTRSPASSRSGIGAWSRMSRLRDIAGDD